VHTVLEASDSFPGDPAGGLRRSRLMPERHPNRSELQTDPRLMAARKRLARLESDPNFHLEA
jgi:hypothetical protein